MNVLAPERVRVEPLADVTFAGEPAALFRCAVALPIPHRLPKVPPERSAAFLVLLDATVDGLMADLEQVDEFKPAADLFRAEFVAQKRFNQLPLR